MHLTKKWDAGALITVIAAVMLGVVASAGASGPAPGALPAPFRAEAEALVVGANLAGQMEAALGSEFAGVWFDPATAQMHVGVTSPAARRVAAAVATDAGLGSLVTETHVASTWEQLARAQQKLNQGLGDLLAQGEARTWPVPDDNSLMIELGSAVSRSRLAEARRQAAGTGVTTSISVASTPQLLGVQQAGRCNQFEKAKANANCNKPIVAGVRIESGNGEKCSAGPAVLLEDLSTIEKSTATYLLTAGHCISAGGGIGGEWSAFTKAPAKELIGKAVERLNGEKGLKDKVDVGVIKINNPGKWVHEGANAATPVTPAIAPWNKAEEAEPIAVTGQGAIPVKGTEVCVSGATSGTHCGKVLATGVTVVFAGGVTVETLVEVETNAGEPVTEGGDSGAPWFLKATPGEVLGTHVGLTAANKMLFEPLSASFENLATKYKLLTTGNEKRTHPGGPGYNSNSPTKNTNLSGSQTTTNELKFESGVAKCTTATFTGTQTGNTVASISLHPVYSACKFAGLAATITTTGCNYGFEKTSGSAAEGTNNKVAVVCEAGKSITIATAICTITIGAQAGLTNVKMTNSSPEASVTAKAEITGLAYTEAGGACVSPGAHANGTYSGSVLLSGTEDGGSGAPVTIWVA